MGTAKATKAADKSQVCRKLVSALQKLYGKSVPKIDLPVLETMLFAACLEDNPWAMAEAGLKKLLASCFDLNEVRVSSVNELEQTLIPLRDSDWKGMRIRSILRHVFETTYTYDFEKLRRQTLEQALKTLKKFHDVTPFIRDFVLHEILGSHIVVLDKSMLNAARWLGLVPAHDNLHDACEFLKGGVKKSEVSEFCFLLRSLATDPKYIPRFADPPDHELSMNDVMDRFVELQSPPKKKAAKPAAAVETSVSHKHSAAKKTEHSAVPAGSAKNSEASRKPAATPSKATVAGAAKSSVQARSPQASRLPAGKVAAAAKPSPSKPVLKGLTTDKASKSGAVKASKSNPVKQGTPSSKKQAAPAPRAAVKKITKKK
jgi:hypothetical protein